MIRVTLCFLSLYASEKRSFFSFRKLGRLLFGGPLVGVEAPTVGADLCVRPSSPERSLFCGRTRRSAPTQATSARKFYSSNAVIPICFLSSYASKKRSFSRFGSSVDFSSGDRSSGWRLPPYGRTCVSARPHLSAVYSAGGHIGPPLQIVTFTPKSLLLLLYYNGRHPARHYPCVSRVAVSSCVPTTGYSSGVLWVTRSR